MQAITRKWIYFLWPIERSEWKKFFSMATLMFLILLNQNLIRGLRDSLVVNLMGAESSSFIKLFIEMPIGVLFVCIYTFLCNKVPMKSIFRSIILFFLFFFIVFGFLLFPYQTLLHPAPEVVTRYIALYPYLKWFFVVWGQWTLALFYAMGELWPMVVFTLLYWQLANKITTTEEASRFYFFFNLFGQANLLLSGSIMVYFAHKKHFLLPLITFLGIDKSESTLQVTTLMVVIISLSICILLLHTYIEKYIVIPTLPAIRTATSLRIGLFKSFRLILSSRYLLLICLLMVAYSMTINLIEVLWNHEVKCFYTRNSAQFMAYHGTVLRWTGIVALFCSLIGNTIIRKIGWMGVALVTPVMTLVVGGIFFLLIVAKEFHCITDSILGMPTLAIIVCMGGIQNILAKGTKYCFFDATKEMAYIPLNNEMQTKGKATVDILGGKLGKACGSILHVICYTLFSSYQPEQLSPFLMVIYCCICTVWIVATHLLAQAYYQLVATKN